MCKFNKISFRRGSGRWSRSAIQDSGCDWRESSKEGSFSEIGVLHEMFPKGCNRGTISYVERKIVPEGQRVMTK